MSSNELEPISPQTAKERYLEKRKQDASTTSIRTIKKGTDEFIKWCEQAEVENMNNVRGRELNQFNTWCRETSDKNNISLNGTMSTVRRFLVYCVKIEAVYPDVPDKVQFPNVDKDAEVSTEKPSDEQVEGASQYLEQTEPASRNRAIFEFILEIGCRAGAVAALDVGDVNIDEKVVKFRHRPADSPDVKGTPLKNGSDGERDDNISTGLAEILEKYRDSPDRYDVEDEFGRKPFFTTENGRVSPERIRKILYKLTRPCKYSNTCPHDRDENQCKAAKNRYASKCPSVTSPHPLRRYSIEHQIEKGVPKEHISDRVDVSVPVLNKHYDTRTKERKRKQRLKILERLFDGYGAEGRTMSSEEIAAVTDSDGTIDPVALHELVNESEPKETDSNEEKQERVPEDTERSSEDSSDNSDENPVSDDSQRTVFDFTDESTVVSQPLLLGAYGGVLFSAWLPDRLQRELMAITPDSEPSPWPDAERAIKGAAAYTLFVTMVALDLTLMGALSV